MKWILMLFSIITLKTCDSSNMQKSNTMLNNTYSVKMLNGKRVSEFKLTIAFNDSTKQVSGFSGCNRFFGSYTIEDATLRIRSLASTRKMCSPKFNTIESDMLDQLSRVNALVLENDVLKLLEEDNVLLKAEKKDTSPLMSFEYLQQSRGNFQSIKINKKTISIQNKRAGDIIKIKCHDEQWQKLVTEIENVKLENIPNLEAPSQKRFFDGAAIAKLKVIYEGKTYETSSFDHGNPHPAIANLVKEILSIAQNIE